MATTPVYGLRYQSPTDPPDGAALGKNLAEDVEAQLQRIDGVIGAAPVEAFQTANDTSASASYVPGSTHGVAITAPDSGRVKITFGGYVGSNAVAISTATPRSLLSDIVRTGSTVGSGTTVLAADDTRAVPYFCADTAAGYKYQYGCRSHLVTGLTAGAAYNVATVFRDADGGATAAVNDRWLIVEPA